MSCCLRGSDAHSPRPCCCTSQLILWNFSSRVTCHEPFHHQSLASTWLVRVYSGDSSVLAHRRRTSAFGTRLAPLLMTEIHAMDPMAPTRRVGRKSQRPQRADFLHSVSRTRVWSWAWLKVNYCGNNTLRSPVYSCTKPQLHMHSYIQAYLKRV